MKSSRDSSKISLESKKGKHNSRSISPHSKDFIKINIGAVRNMVKLPQAPQNEKNIIEFLDQDTPVFMHIKNESGKATCKGSSPKQEFEELLVDATPKQDHHKL